MWPRLIMVYFALSLFGMYESNCVGAGAVHDANEERGGYAGITFMALTFTITSFKHGPFLGPLLAAAKETQ